MTLESQWEQRKPNITKITDQINELLKNIVVREVQDISGKIESLHQMGFLKDSEELQKMKEKLKQLNLQE